MKRYNCILLLFVTLVIMAACEDFLDRPPLDKMSNNDYWKTPNDLKNYVLQFYPQLPSFQNEFTANSDEDSDNAMSSTISMILNGERTRSTGNWRSQWTNIRNINIFFDNYQKATGDYKQFLGEAYFFRSWFYFDLVRKYGDVPWYETALEVNSEELFKARDPRTVVIDNILADLDNAILNLGTRSDVGSTKINKEAALAFKTRVALYEGTWQKYHAEDEFATPGTIPSKYFQACVDASEELINGSSYIKGLYPKYYELFGLDDMASVNEVFLWKAANSNETMGHEAQLYVTTRSIGAGVTWDLVSSYYDKNGEPYNYLELASTIKGNIFLKQIAEDCDPRLRAIIWIPGDLKVASANQFFDKPSINEGSLYLCPTGFQRKKYSNPYSSAAGKVYGGYSETGFIILRYGEVLLNYAEAKYELSGVVAYNELNLLRLRVGMPDFNVHSQSSDFNPVNYGYPISDELYEIRKERRNELALEDRRVDDYRRWAAYKLFFQKRALGYPFDQTEFPSFNPLLNENGLIDYYKNVLPNGYQFKPERDYLESIPQDELTLNPELTQNPGW